MPDYRIVVYTVQKSIELGKTIEDTKPIAQIDLTDTPDERHEKSEYLVVLSKWARPGHPWKRGKVLFDNARPRWELLWELADQLLIPERIRIMRQIAFERLQRIEEERACQDTSKGEKKEPESPEIPNKPVARKDTPSKPSSGGPT